MKLDENVQFDCELTCVDWDMFESETVSSGSYFDSGFGNYLPWDKSSVGEFSAPTAVEVRLLVNETAAAVVKADIDYYEEYEPEWVESEPYDDCLRHSAHYEPLDMDDEYVIERALDDDRVWDRVRDAAPLICDACRVGYRGDTLMTRPTDVSHCDELIDAVDRLGSLEAVCASYPGCAL